MIETMQKYLITVILVITALTVSVSSLKAQDSPPEYVVEAIRATEKMFGSSDDASIRSFINEYMIVEENLDQQYLFNDLKQLRSDVTNRMDDIMVNPAEEGLIFTFTGSDTSVRVLLQVTPEGIEKLVKIGEDHIDSILITKGNIEELFRKAEQRGMAGVIYVVKDGQQLISKGFGLANSELGSPNITETIFGIGSRPIDFTKAAIYHLEQQGMVQLQDPITMYFDGVPADKKEMTIEHLMSGRSGLPDFFHTEDDRDPDLQWIDRNTAENRILNLSLLFKPGREIRHSHTAFGLLAILVERVSGLSYESYLKTYFFDPAKMEATGSYGEHLGRDANDFAVGSGPQKVGVPNIPPNWGPTSWLIKGSGGMYSNLPDLLKFYEYVRSGNIFEDKYTKKFQSPSVTLDGSDRGFELFNVYESDENQLYLFLNNRGDQQEMMQLLRSLESFMINE